MVVEFFKTLIEAIRRSKKGERIRDMNRYRHIQLPAGIPHRIKSWIINLHQGARGDVLAEVKPQRLEDLQAASSIVMRSLDRLRLKFRIIRLLGARVRGFSEGVKASGKSAIILGHSIH